MAWYPGAQRMELQPESDSQPAIRPTQVIFHSIAAPWTPKRTYEYWRDSTNLESHFGLGYDGALAQFIGTETRADANYKANRRPDGTGAISLESASNDDHSDPWTDEQVEVMIELGVWAHRTHGIPLRVCQTADDPGFGYHSLHSAWAVGGTACPGAVRIQQFRKNVFPGIVARATNQPSEEDDMPSAAEIWGHLLDIPDGRRVSASTVLAWTDNRHNVIFGTLQGVEDKVEALTAAVAALTARLDAAKEA